MICSYPEVVNNHREILQSYEMRGLYHGVLKNRYLHYSLEGVGVFVHPVIVVQAVYGTDYLE